MSSPESQPSTPSVTEEDIARLVRQFYTRARSDQLLGDIFAAAVEDWEAHFLIVQDFWSQHLLGTKRYRGSPFPPHLRLPVEPEHFDRWMQLFRATAEEVLPPVAARQALARAAHMAEGFKAGLFPWKLPDGSISRHQP